MQNQEFRGLYKDLLSQNWKGKQVWEHMCAHVLTAAPHFVGDDYKGDFKLMVVGRAVNGWKVNFEKCSAVNDVLDTIMDQTYTFDDVVDENGIDDGDSKYFYSKSPFWRLIRKTLDAYGESENWNKKILWSNLYKVAPWEAGNPGWLLIRGKLETYIEIIKKEIEVYEPTHILFVTDMDYFDPYPNSLKYPGFKDALGVKEIDGYEHVVASEKYNNSKIVVCKRPEFKNTDEMVKEIKEVFDMRLK